MFDIDTSNIATPIATAVPSFDDLKTEFVDDIVSELEKTNSTLAEAIRTTLNNPAEFGTVIVEGAVRVLQDRYRYVNHQALQMLAVWAKDSNLDAKLIGHSAEIMEFELNITLYGSTLPGGTIDKTEALATLQAYVDERHKLLSRISVSNVYGICEDVAGVTRAVIDLKEDIVCAYNQAPYCTKINLTVEYE